MYESGTASFWLCSKYITEYLSLPWGHVISTESSVYGRYTKLTYGHTGYNHILTYGHTGYAIVWSNPITWEFIIRTIYLALYMWLLKRVASVILWKQENRKLGSFVLISSRLKIKTIGCSWCLLYLCYTKNIPVMLLITIPLIPCVNRKTYFLKKSSILVILSHK